jgi:hypothetical protein
MPGPERRQTSPLQLDRGRNRAPPESSLVIHTGQLGSLKGQFQGLMPLAASERPGSNRGRIRAISSDCLRSPLQPVLAGHSLIAPTQAQVRKMR